MEGNDIAPFSLLTYGCMFEGLIINVTEETKPGKWGRKDKVVERWRANDLPLKSLIHLTTKLGIKVDVFTYMDDVEKVDAWLSRRGAVCQVTQAEDVYDLAEMVKYDRDIHTMFTGFFEEQATLGIRSTLVGNDTQWGF